MQTANSPFPGRIKRHFLCFCMTEVLIKRVCLIICLVWMVSISKGFLFGAFGVTNWTFTHKPLSIWFTFLISYEMHHKSSVVIITEYRLLIYINTCILRGLISITFTNSDRWQNERWNRRQLKSLCGKLSFLFAAEYHLQTIKWARLRSSLQTSVCLSSTEAQTTHSLRLNGFRAAAFQAHQREREGKVS